MTKMTSFYISLDFSHQGIVMYQIWFLVAVKITLFVSWVVTPCGLVARRNVPPRSLGLQWLKLISALRWRQSVFPKRRYLPASTRCVTTRNQHRQGFTSVPVTVATWPWRVPDVSRLYKPLSLLFGSVIPLVLSKLSSYTVTCGRFPTGTRVIYSVSVVHCFVLTRSALWPPCSHSASVLFGLHIESGRPCFLLKVPHTFSREIILSRHISNIFLCFTH